MRQFIFILVAVVCFGISANAKFLANNSENAQTECSSTSNFLLLIENTENGIKITSTQGCAFKELRFSLKEGQKQEIDQNGMRNSNDRVVQDDNLASFCITIQKSKEGLVLEGIDGTAFKRLSFSCRIGQSQLIDQNGMR